MLPSSVTPSTEPVIWRTVANVTRIAYLLNSRQEADENDLVRVRDQACRIRAELAEFWRS